MYCSRLTFGALSGLMLWGMHGGARTAQAHAFVITEVLAVFKTNGTYQLDMTVDVDALALDAPPEAVIAPQLRAMSPERMAECIKRARDKIEQAVRVRFDGVQLTPDVTFPEYGTSIAAEAAVPTVLGTTARLTGRIPEQAKAFTFGASSLLGPVLLTIFDQMAVSGVKYIVEAGADSPPYRLGEAVREQGHVEVAARYLVLGFEHILPKGLDHILFVLGLFLLSTRLKSLLWQLTAFTLAHSITLALSMSEVLSLPPRVVEPLIALSISYVAIENILTPELKPWRPMVVFAFGLLHGLGFAGALQELGLSSDEFVTGLVSFNVGVELGQLAVVLLAFLSVRWLRKKPWYRRAVVLPLSALIAVIGVFWFIQRAAYGP